MKLISALLLLVSLSACAGDEPAGTGATLENLRGQWLVINYWARWCKPCIEEIPELNALDSNYGQVTVLGVNYDGLQGEALTAQAAELNVSFELLQDDPSALLGVPRPVVLPTTLLVGPDGTFREALAGPQTVNSLATAMGLETEAKE